MSYFQQSGHSDDIRSTQKPYTSSNSYTHSGLSQNNRNDAVLHGVTLAMILDYLVEEYGFAELGELIRINCFTSNPSKQSSLKFLRKTEWARLQVQGLYVRTVLETGKHAVKNKETPAYNHTPNENLEK
jgi:uncharacterized protein (DUF2132 family)